MPAEDFLDTNIIVYAFDSEAPEKQSKAREILSRDGWFVSWQVIQEFCAVALHKFAVPLRSEDLRDYVSLKLWPRCRVLPSQAVNIKALEMHHRFGYRYYDALIVAAALAGEAGSLLSEDLQDGQTISGMKIRNPF